MKDIYQKIIELKDRGTQAMLCTIVRTKGSTPLKAGAKMLVTGEGEIFGSVGGGSIEAQTIDKASELFVKNKSDLINIDLTNKDGNCCGGTAEIFIEPILKNYPLYVFGAGHVGKALVKILENHEFDITVIDNREGIFDGWEAGHYRKVISKFKYFLNELKFNENVFIAIISYDHLIDWDILSYCIDKPWRYLGMMGSKSKVKSMTKSLLEMGITDDRISKIDMPIGLDINAGTASEIALSIASKLIQEKNKK